MAMKPFCGYNYADYFAHWLSSTSRAQAAEIFHVNWFRKGDDGKFLWPGYGENLRVLEWMIGRCDGTADADETPIGYCRASATSATDGLKCRRARARHAARCRSEGWRDEIANIANTSIVGRAPPAKLKAEQRRVAGAIEEALQQPAKSATG